MAKDSSFDVVSEVNMQEVDNAYQQTARELSQQMCIRDSNNKVPIFSSKLTLGFIEGKLSEFRIRAPKFREVKGGSHVNLG